MAWERDPLAERLIQNQRQIDLLLLEQSRLAAELARGKLWDEDGFNHAIDWLRFNCHVTSTLAADLITVGEQEARLTESVQAMNEGSIGYSHLKVMARTADAVGEVFDETKLLKLAKENSPGKFHYKCLHYRHSVDAKGYARQQEDLFESRGLRVSTAEDGCLLVSGGLDPVGGAAVRTTLEALAQPSGDHDDRNLEQRLADALVEVCTHGGQQKVALEVTASIETLLDVAGAPGAENEFTLPISSKTVERWACDCSISRILLQDSVVIDVGRAERTIKGARRRALNARDQHCQWPGCERPASWCDGHHIKHWINGGGSELDNLILLCARHHRLTHEGGWQLVKTDDGRIMPIAPTITFGRLKAPGSQAP